MRDAVVWYGWARFNLQTYHSLPLKYQEIYQNESNKQNFLWHRYENRSIFFLICAGMMLFYYLIEILSGNNILIVIVWITMLTLLLIGQWQFFEWRLNVHKIKIVDRCRKLLENLIIWDY